MPASPKTTRQSWMYGLTFPLRCLLSSKAAWSLRLTPIDDERVNMVLQYCQGKILDIGCGANQLVRQYRDGVGVDVYLWKGMDLLCDTARQPFRDNSFETITMLACLNHIAEKEQVLREAKRLLKPGGRILITMIGPLTGYFCHVIRRRFDPDQLERGVHRDEQLGLTGGRVKRLLKGQGFKVEPGTFCLFGLNRLYIGIKSA